MLDECNFNHGHLYAHIYRIFFSVSACVNVSATIKKKKKKKETVDQINTFKRTPLVTVFYCRAFL